MMFTYRQLIGYPRTRSVQFSPRAMDYPVVAWHAVISWCTIQEWLSLWLIGNSWFCTVIQNAPNLTGTGYYCSFLEKLSGLITLDLSRDRMLPHTTLANLPVQLRTLKLDLCTKVSTSVLQYLPRTITSLSITVRDTLVMADELPPELVHLAITGRGPTQIYAKDASFPHLTTLTVNLKDFTSHSVTALELILSRSPHLCSFTCNSVFINSKREQLLPADPAEVRALDLTALMYHSLLDKQFAKYSLAQVKLTCTLLDLPDKLCFRYPLTQLTITSAIPDVMATVAILPLTLTSFTGHYLGENSGVFARLTALRELNLQGNRGSTRGCFEGAYSQLRKLTLINFWDITVPESVTDLVMSMDNSQHVLAPSVYPHFTLRTGSNSNFTTLQGIPSHILSNLTLQQDFQHLTSLHVMICDSYLVDLLAEFPTGQLLDLNINGGDLDIYVTNDFLEKLLTKLMVVSCRFTRLRKLSIKLGHTYQAVGMAIRDQPRGIGCTISQKIILPSSITSLSLDVHAIFTGLVLPPALTALALLYTEVPLVQISRALQKFVWYGSGNLSSTMALLDPLPSRVVEIIIDTRNTFTPTSRHPTIVQYRLNRERYLHKFSWNGREVSHTLSLQIHQE